MKIFGIIIAVILALVLMTAGGWAYKYYTAEIRGSIDAHEQIESAPSRIGRYEHFFNLCATAQSQKAALSAQKNRLEYVDDSQTENRIRANIAGLEAQVARTVNMYNSQASRDYTSGRFLASNLPYQISVEGETQCAK